MDKPKDLTKTHVTRRPDGSIVVKAMRSETIKHPDGRQSVVIHMPLLKIGDKVIGRHGEKVLT